MKRFLDKRTWDQPYKLHSWISFSVFMFACLVFLVVFIAPQWYVCRPPGEPIAFGIWKLCYRGYCDYDMIYEYRVIGHNVFQDFTTKYAEAVLTVQWMMVFALMFLVINFVTYIVYMVGYPTMFTEVLFQFFAGVLCLASVSMWGVNLRGPTEGLRYGWAFWLAAFVCLLLIANSVFMLVVSLKVWRKRHPVVY